MRFSLDELVQRQLHYASSDEVDSILIDGGAHARSLFRAPLKNRRSCTSRSIESIPKLKRAATISKGNCRRSRSSARAIFIVDEKSRAVVAHRAGIASCERLLNVDNLYDPQHITILHHVQQGSARTRCTSATWITS